MFCAFLPKISACETKHIQYYFMARLSIEPTNHFINKINCSTRLHFIISSHLFSFFNAPVLNSRGLRNYRIKYKKIIMVYLVNTFEIIVFLLAISFMFI